VSEIGWEAKGSLTVFIDELRFVYVGVRFNKHYPSRGEGGWS